MKELQTILKRLRRISNETAVLATVVDVRGSSYRLPGARMLILNTGETVGTVSGGCLEADVMERAKQVLKTGEPQVFVYDTTAAEDSVFSLNMGCRGVIRILLEAVSYENDFVRFLESRVRQRKSGVAVTLIAAPENYKTGARILFDENGVAASDFDADASELLLPAVQKVFAQKRSFFQTYNSAEFFVEYIAPLISLVVFGAGADAAPLVRFADDLGWHSIIVDHRAAITTKERFPEANEIVIARAENLTKNLTEILFSAEQTAAVVMTHNYERDKEILRRIANAPLAYVGVLGPKRRTEQLLEDLRREGESFSADDLEKLYAPVGLDIGAATPEGIALSIAAEIESVLSKRAGGFLRDRSGSIYARDGK